jgi:ASC-1-like (ASCH) protein
MYKVCEENRNINDEILQVMQQNKMYKMEAMKEKENVEKKVTELETMEEKLIAYYEMYMGEVARKEAVEAKNK